MQANRNFPELIAYLWTFTYGRDVASGPVGPCPVLADAILDELRSGLAECIDDGAVFDALFNFYLDRADGPDYASIPGSLKQTVLENGLAAVSQPDLIALATHPVWMAELRDAVVANGTPLHESNKTLTKEDPAPRQRSFDEVFLRMVLRNALDHFTDQGMRLREALNILAEDFPPNIGPEGKLAFWKTAASELRRLTLSSAERVMAIGSSASAAETVREGIKVNAWSNVPGVRSPGELFERDARLSELETEDAESALAAQLCDYARRTPHEIAELLQEMPDAVEGMLATAAYRR